MRSKRDRTSRELKPQFDVVPVAPAQVVNQNPIRGFALRNRFDKDDTAAMPDDVKLAWAFTCATLDHDPGADRYREQIVGRWGQKALISLTFAIVAARIYPTVKYAMGHGQACTRIVVAGAPVAVGQQGGGGGRP
jgi:hypothetical protein